MKPIIFTLLVLTSPFSALAGQCATLIDQMQNMGELKKILRCLDNKPAHSINHKARAFQKATIKTKVTTQRYLFEVEHCVRQANALACTVIITNKNKSVYSPDYREFGIYAIDSHLFDEFGNEYNAIKAQMGKVIVESQGPSNRKNFKDGYLEKYMPLGVPMKLSMTFSDIEKSATTVMALNIKFSYRDGKDLASNYVTLEGIAIDKVMQK